MINMRIDLMQAEWDAWKLVYKHWPGDINKDHPELVYAIRLWGERLVDLRQVQKPEQRQRALQKAIDDYTREVTNG